MNTIQFKIFGSIVVFVIIFLTGFWLSRSGSPYGTGLLTVHKLIALAVLVFLIITMVQVNKAVGLNGMEWALGVITAVLFIGTIIVGGLLSTDLELPTAVTTFHHIAPWAVVVLTVISFYIFLSSKT